MASFLIDQGAPGLLTEDVDGKVRLTAHFEGPAPVASIRLFCSQLPEFFPGIDTAEIGTGSVAEETWAENWKEHFPALVIGDRLFVRPPWVREVPPGRVGIVIDPGMAFGTGHHASTRGCLIMLEQVLSDSVRPVVLDLGTGSGILAIAAAKLGVERVWAVDVDREACLAARENVVANGVGERVLVCESVDELSVRCDLVLANLFATQLVELAPRFAGWLRPGGIVIGSGLRDDEEETVTGAWVRSNLTSRRRYEEEGWVTLVYGSGGAG